MRKNIIYQKKGNDANDGSALKSFSTISTAVKYTFASDTITVHAGTYRGWINPVRGGESEQKKIVYRVVRSRNLFMCAVSFYINNRIKSIRKFVKFVVW